jgi:hypothetical protein
VFGEVGFDDDVLFLGDVGAVGLHDEEFSFPELTF